MQRKSYIGENNIEGMTSSEILNEPSVTSSSNKKALIGEQGGQFSHSLKFGKFWGGGGLFCCILCIRFNVPSTHVWSDQYGT